MLHFLAKLRLLARELTNGAYQRLPLGDSRHCRTGFRQRSKYSSGCELPQMVSRLKTLRSCSQTRATSEMAKQPTTFPHVSEAALHVMRLLRSAGFTVKQDVVWHNQRIDVWAERFELGRLRRYGIDVKLHLKPIGRNFVTEATSRIAPFLSSELNEYWIISDGFTVEARGVAERLQKIRALTFDELEEILRKEANSDVKKGSRKTRTKIGKSVVANKTEIELASSSLMSLVDEKVKSLRAERPNSPESIATRDETIAHYEVLKERLQRVSQSIRDFEKGSGTETALVKAVKTFSAGVGDWWAKAHQKICERAYDSALFGLAVTICSMAGSGGKVAVAVSAALVGGKQFGDAIRGLKGLWS